MSVLANQFKKRSKAFAVSACIVLVAGIGLVDYLTGYALLFSAFYLLPVGLAAWYVGAPFGIGT